MYVAADGYTCQNLMPDRLRQVFADQRRNPKYGEDDFIHKAYLRLFMPDGPFIWYVSDFDGEDTMYGYVINTATPDFSEEGSFSLRDLEQLRGYMGLPVERDCHFEPTALFEVREAQQGP